jgi:hypothetical protein
VRSTHDRDGRKSDVQPGGQYLEGDAIALSLHHHDRHASPQHPSASTTAVTAHDGTLRRTTEAAEDSAHMVALTTHRGGSGAAAMTLEFVA